MEYTEKWAKKNAVNALPLPSYSSFYRIAMDVPEAVRILMREAERAYYNKASMYTRRDYESIASNDWWVGDTYTCDTLTPVSYTHLIAGMPDENRPAAVWAAGRTESPWPLPPQFPLPAAGGYWLSLIHI